MKYYSEILKKTFDSEKECLEAEKKHAIEVAEAEKKKAESTKVRKERAKEVEDAFKVVKEAQKKYNKLLSTFVKDYGAFHMTLATEDTFDDIFDFLTLF